MTGQVAAADWLSPPTRGGFESGPYQRGKYKSREVRTDVIPVPLVGLQTSADRPNIDIGRLALRVLAALTASPTDFRRRDSLAREFAVRESDIDLAIALLGDRVRTPQTTDPRYAHWYRLASSGPTWRERWRALRAMAGKTSIR
jgi:hypothetical protein